MTGRPLLVFFCLLELAAPARAAASPSPPHAPQTDADQDAGRDALLARLAVAADPDEADGIVALSTGSISIPAPTPAICC